MHATEARLVLEPNPGVLSVGNLLSSIGIESVSLPLGIDSISELYVTRIVLNQTHNSLVAEVNYLETLSPFEGVSVTNPTVSINVSRHGGARLNVDGELSIFGTSFDATITLDEETTRRCQQDS